jgi:hypothetical protein
VIAIPAIGVSAPVIPLGLIVGHVDSQAGPAVFYRLSALRPGDGIEIRLESGSMVRYVARWMKLVPKERCVSPCSRSAR